MQTIKQLLQDAQQQLIESASARLDAEVLLAHVLQVDRSYLYAWPEKVIVQEHAQQFNALIQRRAQGEPVAYLTGKKEFYSLLLNVDASTLIPRPETELLVELALKLFPQTACKVIDLGTGTGAIALALAHARPDWKITAVDREPQAVRLAQRNVCTHGLTNVGVMHSDWFSFAHCKNVDEQKDDEKAFDLVISNPPYIDSDDVHLQQGDVQFEPRSALVSAENGLADIKQISAEAHLWLKSGGLLMLEHGYQQGEAVRNILLHNHYQHVQTFHDLENRERVTMGYHK